METSIVIWPVFILFSFWWWTLIVGIFTWILICTANEWFGAGVIPIIFLAIGLTLLGDTRLVSILLSWHMAWLIPSYLLMGVGWSMIKWLVFVRNKMHVYNDLKQRWITSKGSIDGFDGHIRNHHEFRHYDNLIPQASYEKNRIVGWVAYWPWSLLWTVCDDLIINLFDTIFKVCRRAYDYISDLAFNIE